MRMAILSRALLRTTPILRYALTRYAAFDRSTSYTCPSLFRHFESSIQTIPYTRFAMKKHEVPKTNNPAVTVVGISNLITGLSTKGMSYLTKTILGCQFPAQEPSHSFPTYPSQYSWATRSYQEQSTCPRRRQSAPAARSYGY